MISTKMTPVEKAEELIWKFYDANGPSLPYQLSKECAIICVEQIIQELGSKGVYEYADPMVLVFYQKVLEHIKNS